MKRERASYQPPKPTRGHSGAVASGTRCTLCGCCDAVIAFCGENLCAACDDGTHAPVAHAIRPKQVEIELIEPSRPVIDATERIGNSLLNARVPDKRICRDEPEAAQMEDDAILDAWWAGLTSSAKMALRGQNVIRLEGTVQ